MAPVARLPVLLLAFLAAGLLALADLVVLVFEAVPVLFGAADLVALAAVAFLGAAVDLPAKAVLVPGAFLAVAGLEASVLAAADLEVLVFFAEAVLAEAVLVAAVLELAEGLAFLVPVFEAEAERAGFLPVRSSAAFVTFRTTLVTTLDTASGTMLV
jgi:hypothetical protein